MLPVQNHALSKSCFLKSFLKISVMCWLTLIPSLTTVSLLSATFRSRWFLSAHSTKSSATALYSTSCPFLIHPTTTESSALLQMAWPPSCTGSQWCTRSAGRATEQFPVGLQHHWPPSQVCLWGSQWSRRGWTRWTPRPCSFSLSSSGWMVSLRNILSLGINVNVAEYILLKDWHPPSERKPFGASSRKVIKSFRFECIPIGGRVKTHPLEIIHFFGIISEEAFPKRSK